MATMLIEIIIIKSVGSVILHSVKKIKRVEILFGFVCSLTAQRFFSTIIRKEL